MKIASILKSPIKIFKGLFELIIGDLTEEDKKELRKQLRKLVIAIATAYAEREINKVKK